MAANKIVPGLKDDHYAEPKGTEAGHNIDGKGTNGWESIAKNRAVETKNKKKNKLKIVHHHI